MRGIRILGNLSRAYLALILQAKNKETAISLGGRSGAQLSNHIWNLPPQPFISLCYDEFVVNNGSVAGCGGVVRDARGKKFLFGFSHKLDSCSVLEAEFWGIYHGVFLVWGRGYNRIIVESNSTRAINLL